MASAASLISRSPERKTRMSPSSEEDSSLTASQMASTWSRSRSSAVPTTGR